MSAQTCPACLGTKYEMGRCNQCGFRAADYTAPPSALPMGSEIGAYRIGVMKTSSRQSQIYTGFHSGTSAPVIIEEFFPQRVVGRMAGNPMVMVASGEAERENRFQQGCMLMETSDQKRPLKRIDTVRANNTIYSIFEVMPSPSVAAQCEALADYPICFRDSTGKPKMTINLLNIPPMPQERIFNPGEINHQNPQTVEDEVSKEEFYHTTVNTKEKQAQPRKKLILLIAAAVAMVVLLGTIALRVFSGKWPHNYVVPEVTEVPIQSTGVSVTRFQMNTPLPTPEAEIAEAEPTEAATETSAASEETILINPEGGIKVRPIVTETDASTEEKETEEEDNTDAASQENEESHVAENAESPLSENDEEIDQEAQVEQPAESDVPSFPDEEGQSGSSVTIRTSQGENGTIYNKDEKKVTAEDIPTDTPSPAPTDSPSPSPTDTPSSTLTNTSSPAPTEIPTETPPSPAPTETPTDAAALASAEVSTEKPTPGQTEEMEDIPSPNPEKSMLSINAARQSALDRFASHLWIVAKEEKIKGELNDGWKTSRNKNLEITLVKDKPYQVTIVDGKIINKAKNQIAQIAFVDDDSSQAYRVRSDKVKLYYHIMEDDQEVTSLKEGDNLLLLDPSSSMNTADFESMIKIISDKDLYPVINEESETFELEGISWQYSVENANSTSSKQQRSEETIDWDHLRSINDKPVQSGSSLMGTIGIYTDQTGNAYYQVESIVVEVRKNPGDTVVQTVELKKGPMPEHTDIGWNKNWMGTISDIRLEATEEAELLITYAYRDLNDANSDSTRSVWEILQVDEMNVVGVE